MLYITRKNNHNIPYQWHIGEAKPNKTGEKWGDLFEDVVEVSADGHELEYIQKNFSNIRMHAGRFVRWTGEDAQFIYDGLPS